MRVDKAAILVSGGMDSIAALCWAARTYPERLAVLFDYGQPNRDHELTAAQRTASALRVPVLTIAVADTLPRGHGILRAVEDHDGREDGTSPAFVLGRNLVMATSAAAHAAAHWPNGNIDLVLGCNAQDAKRFPDCHPRALLKLGETLRHGIGREIGIITPWIDRTKAQILQVVHADDREHVARSWSCYRATGPCGTCSACVLRAAAFAEVTWSDLSAPAAMTGGDPARCR